MHSTRPRFIGITGTNGKTTTSYLTRAILREAGFRCAVIGTLSGRLTTPSPWHLKRLRRRYRLLRYDWVVMEVSSHGIHQNRIKGIDFTVKALTNITQDHLDYHKTMDEYRRVKLDWFQSGLSKSVTLWHDDSFVHPDTGLKAMVSFQEQNRLLAAEICRSINISERLIQSGLEKAGQVPGRFEFVDRGQLCQIVIDFAHTPDGLEKVLDEAKMYMLAGVEQQRLIVVFGCGGDRDRGKRSQMGEIAARLADVVVVTSDNPRSEDPELIIEEIVAGIDLQESKVQLIVEPDRACAIKQALDIASKNDFVVLAGKGHEDYQIFRDETIHFSDKEEVETHLLNSTK